MQVAGKKVVEGRKVLEEGIERKVGRKALEGMLGVHCATRRYI
jgi:hypothetical protein